MRVSLYGIEMEPWSWADFQSESFQLEAFRTMDFSSAMHGEVGKVITRKNLALRYLPLTSRFCKDMAAQYPLPPTRTFDGVGTLAAAKLDDIYERSRVNLALLQAQQKCQAQNQVLVTVDPTDDPRRFKLRSWIAGEYSTRSKDLLADHLDDVDELIVRVPLTRSTSEHIKVSSLSGDSQAYDSFTQFSYRHYTKERAWVVHPNGDEVGLYNPEGTNPWGIIPAVHCRLEDPRKGYWHSALAQDVNSVQIGLIIVMSDAEHIARLRAPGREVVSGVGAQAMAGQLPAGPENVWVLNGELKYESHSPSPATDRLLKAIETTANLLATYRYVAQDGLWASTGITGAAKEAERLEVQENRVRQEQIWQGLEQDLGRVIATMTGSQIVSINPHQLRVSVEYHYVKARQNDLQASQSKVLNFFLGLDSATESISREEGVNAADARLLMEDRLKAAAELIDRWREWGQVPPGLDALKSQLGIGGAGPGQAA